MTWSEIRRTYPNTWSIIEALETHSDTQQRVLDRIAVVERCADGASAFESYQRLHQEHPWRELYYVHTGREALDIRERHWVGTLLRPNSLQAARRSSKSGKHASI